MASMNYMARANARQIYFLELLAMMQTTEENAQKILSSSVDVESTQNLAVSRLLAARCFKDKVDKDRNG